MNEKIRRFSDMRTDPLPCDTKVKLDQVVDLDLEFRDFQVFSGRYGAFVWVIAYDPEQKMTLGFSTGAKVIMRKLAEAKEKKYLPLLGKIVKKGLYYDII